MLLQRHRMISIFLLTPLAFIAATSGGAMRGNRRSERDKLPPFIRVFNGSEVVLSCPPAELLVRTHMAPDFEHPQLVRRVDWFQGEVLVASFQQDVLTDISQQWWVASSRLELRKPFYQLRISPVLPTDSGDYKCWLEADPLFSGDSATTSTLSLLAMVKPMPPAKPQVTAYNEQTVTLRWNHSHGAVHQPILHYSVLTSRVDDPDSVKVITTPSNITTILIPGLVPNTEYTFSVRAENLAGESAFGPELAYKTSGQPPKFPPVVSSIVNGSAPGCVDIQWRGSVDEAADAQHTSSITGYRMIVHQVGSDAMREWYVRGRKRGHALCSLTPFTSYMLSLEADNSFGHSPPTRVTFKTDEASPGGPPTQITVRAMGSDAAMIQWGEPTVPNGVITSYQIYYREHAEQNSHRPLVVRLLIDRGEKSTSFVYNLTELVPQTHYRLRMSASTARGEGEKSAAIHFKTERPALTTPTITGLFYRCSGGDLAGHGRNGKLRITWTDDNGHAMTSDAANESLHYKVVLDWGRRNEGSSFNTTKHELLVGDLTASRNYTVRVAAVGRSAVEGGRLLESSYSPAEIFSIHEDSHDCTIEASICAGDVANCRTILGTTHKSRNGSSLIFSPLLLLNRSSISIILLLCGAVITVSTALLSFWYMRRRCSLFKNLIEKVEKKGTNTVETQQEILSLVNDSPEPIYGQTVAMPQFHDYCLQLAADANDGYKGQFQELELDTHIESADVEGRTSANSNELPVPVAKNRYLNIQAAAHSRIRIRKDGTLPGTSPDGYINANYVDSCDSKNAYIATQAPLPHTFADFWAMVWQEECNLIVVMTNLVENGKRKCDCYWPSTQGGDEVLAFGHLQIRLVAEHINSVFVHRVLELSLLRKGNGAPPGRVVHQLHFTSWRDHEVPDSPFPFLYFLNYASEIHSTGPVVVHCSAGVGRSGCFILIDSVRRHLLQCNRINVQAHLRHIRRQRSHLVQTLEQYMFCHDALHMLVRHGISRQPLLNYAKYVQFLRGERATDGRTRLELQYEELCKCGHVPKCVVRLHGYLALPGYHLDDEYIIGDWPAACNELWSTCWEFKCQTLVLIDRAGESNGCTYFANCSSASAQLLANGDAKNSARGKRRRFMGEARLHGDYLILRNGLGDASHELPQIRVVTTAEDLLLSNNTWREIEKIQAASVHNGEAVGRTLVIDPQGSSTPFVLCALQSIACQLEQERYADLLLYLTGYHHACCGCWASQKTLEFIYDKVVELIDTRKRP